MNYKLYETDDILMFAEEGEEEEGDVGGGGEEDEDEPSDVDKLRSTYDSKLAALQKELDEFKSKAEKSSTDSESRKAYLDAYKAVDDLMVEAKNATDKAKALDALLVHLPNIAHAYGVANQGFVSNYTKFKSAQAERLAFELKSEYGGSIDSYKARLMEAQNEADMRVRFYEIEREASKAPKKRNSDREDRPRIDRGGGSASRTNVLREMEDIDLSTPEGQKQWQEKRGSFRKKLESAAR